MLRLVTKLWGEPAHRERFWRLRAFTIAGIRSEGCADLPRGAGRMRRVPSVRRELAAGGLDFYHKPVKTRSPKAHGHFAAGKYSMVWY